MLWMTSKQGIYANRGIFSIKNIPSAERPYIYWLESKGVLRRIGRGVYVSARAWAEKKTPSERHRAEAALIVPKGVICLLSALHFHEIALTSEPQEIWIAIGPKDRKPRVIDSQAEKSEIHPPALRICRFSGKALTMGIQVTQIAKVKVRITTLEKTLADCFKFRKVIGLNICHEALQASWKRIDHEKFEVFSKICRVRRSVQQCCELFNLTPPE